MKVRLVLLGLALTLVLSGCELVEAVRCPGRCQSAVRSSSSLVDFLYSKDTQPPAENTIPRLRLPVRVGLAFIPEGRSIGAAGLEAARREEMLERIRKRFADRKFVSQIVVIPDYYLRGRGGFESLEGVQRLYGVDVLALVSYDQVTYRDRNDWSLGYLTIVGAFMLKGNQHDVVTLMDLAVVDPPSRSILLRAGGTNDRTRHTTAMDDVREARESQGEGFSAATDDLIAHFDQALTQFEADAKAGKANVRFAMRAPSESEPVAEGALASTGGGGGHRFGGGAFDGLSLVVLAGVLLLMKRPSIAVRLRALSRRAAEKRLRAS